MQFERGVDVLVMPKSIFLRNKISSSPTSRVIHDISKQSRCMCCSECLQREISNGETWCQKENQTTRQSDLESSRGRHSASNCRKWKLLKRASYILYFGFRPCLQKWHLWTLPGDNFYQCRLVLRSRRRQLVMAPCFFVVASVELQSLAEALLGFFIGQRDRFTALVTQKVFRTRTHVSITAKLFYHDKSLEKEHFFQNCTIANWVVSTAGSVWRRIH